MAERLFKQWILNRQLRTLKTGLQVITDKYNQGLKNVLHDIQKYQKGANLEKKKQIQTQRKYESNNNNMKKANSKSKLKYVDNTNEDKLKQLCKPSGFNEMKQTHAKYQENKKKQTLPEATATTYTMNSKDSPSFFKETMSSRCRGLNLSDHNISDNDGLKERSCGCGCLIPMKSVRDERCSLPPEIKIAPACASKGDEKEIVEEKKPQSAFERLYTEHERMKVKSEKLELDYEAKELKNCTFKPKILSRHDAFACQNSNPEVGSKKEDIPHYEKMYTQHMMNQHILDLKRKEIMEEEQKKRKFVASRKPASPSTDSNPFVRLYNQDKIYRNKKKQLTQKVMKVWLFCMICLGTRNMYFAKFEQSVAWNGR